MVTFEPSVLAYYSQGNEDARPARQVMGEMGAYLDDPEQRQHVLDALRSVETEPSVLGVSGHILTTARA